MGGGTGERFLPQFMFNKILLYIIAGLALLCIGLGITVAVEEARITRLKTELNTAILERDSLKALSTSQTENLTNLNILLGEQDKTCRKRLDARKAVDAIFNKTIPPEHKAGRALTPSSVSLRVQKSNGTDRTRSRFPPAFPLRL